MYKRKFPKSKIVDENSSSLSQLQKTSSSSSTSVSIPTKSTMSNKNISDDDESPESPLVLDDFSDFPIEKKRKTVDNYVDDNTDGSEPLFYDNNDVYSYLKQTLISCGLHLKPDQNILCKTDRTYIFV